MHVVWDKQQRVFSLHIDVAFIIKVLRVFYGTPIDDWVLATRTMAVGPCNGDWDATHGAGGLTVSAWTWRRGTECSDTCSCTAGARDSAPASSSSCPSSCLRSRRRVDGPEPGPAGRRRRTTYYDQSGCVTCSASTKRQTTHHFMSSSVLFKLPPHNRHKPSIALNP